ncbi:DUF397 domain-containing protein [Actinoallomurus bryophytorum]|uniref:DUF397 domain-containing protein n=1 Tax=Actinoallomurus bryophytorum TaxID=1490222 RepID=UPI00114E2F47|nr:DUF397 domain-containing protein [Actinoallomurus bryophytorum]
MCRSEPGVPSCVPAVAGWRRSSWSNPSGNCVELAFVPAGPCPSPPEPTGMDEATARRARRPDR